MSPGSSTESYPAFARIGLREDPGKNLNQVTCPDRDSNPGHLGSQADALIVTPQKINTFGWEVLQHLPYSPDLASSDFHLFGPMKKFLVGHRFATDAEVQSIVRRWLYSNRTDFYEQGILKLVPRWEKYVEKLGAYV
ncbi:hypothetical protein ANN_04874 [Periplaneta americana]|uniref:Histone-lysine N-methyltransferase SETMAR n=1 Tax=Periplaneta americana TaxID=6978 RepID=A0ABQ8TBN2_PERAM|nr:hypothetical protein ANN_04874 [Periplaneta americana]